MYGAHLFSLKYSRLPRILIQPRKSFDFSQRNGNNIIQPLTVRKTNSDNIRRYSKKSDITLSKIGTDDTENVVGTHEYQGHPEFPVRDHSLQKPSQEESAKAAKTATITLTTTFGKLKTLSN